eukprot:1145397-Pelagomonas_calceolata.AAC.2
MMRWKKTPTARKANTRDVAECFIVPLPMLQQEGRGGKALRTLRNTVALRSGQGVQTKLHCCASKQSVIRHCRTAAQSTNFKFTVYTDNGSPMESTILNTQAHDTEPESHGSTIGSSPCCIRVMPKLGPTHRHMTLNLSPIEARLAIHLIVLGQCPQLCTKHIKAAKHHKKPYCYPIPVCAWATCSLAQAMLKQHNILEAAILINTWLCVRQAHNMLSSRVCTASRGPGLAMICIQAEGPEMIPYKQGVRSIVAAACMDLLTRPETMMGMNKDLPAKG